MPRATLTFRLPDDEPEFRDAVDGWRAKSVLRSLDEHLRSQIKHGELSDEVEVVLQELREWMRGECAEHGIELP
jgi:hypothetical protein